MIPNEFHSAKNKRQRSVNPRNVKHNVLLKCSLRAQITRDYMSRLQRCTLEVCHPGVTWGICADSRVTTKFGGIPLTADFGDSDTRSVKLSAVSSELLQRAAGSTERSLSLLIRTVG